MGKFPVTLNLKLIPFSIKSEEWFKQKLKGCDLYGLIHNGFYATPEELERGTITCISPTIK